MLDLTIVLLAYGGVRLYEKIKPTKAKKGQKAIVAAKSRNAITPKERRHYQKMAGVTMGTAALRMLHPSPAFTLINIATYTYSISLLSEVHLL